MGAILAAVIGAVLLAIPGSPVYEKPVLGLDLQGGLEVILKAVPPKGHTLTAEDLDRSVTIMQDRINRLGVSEPEIRKQGKDQIVIQLAGIHEADREDGAADAVRLRERPHGAVGRRERQPGRDARPLRAAQAGAEAGGQG